jgi:hypothetical protein
MFSRHEDHCFGPYFGQALAALGMKGSVPRAKGSVPGPRAPSLCFRPYVSIQ